MKHRPGEERLLLNYLLGEVSELEQDLLESNYFRDPQFFTLMLALEDELISDYLAGHLSPHERKQFKRHFLSSAKRRQKFERARRFLACVARQPKIPLDDPADKPAIRQALRLRRTRQAVYLA